MNTRAGFRPARRVGRTAFLLLALASWARSEPVLPPGFSATTVVRDIHAATALAVAPDGRIFYAEQTGGMRVVKDGELLPAPAIDLEPRLDTWWERGLIGMAFHPDFPRTPHLFIVYVAARPYTHHVVSRFTVAGDRLDPDSELVLLEGDDQSQLGGNVPAGHQGGPLCFGSDGMLYIGIGEQTAGEPSQSLDTLQGKILRLRPDGSIPPDNPFFSRTTGKYRAIWAIGIRNPFGLAVEPGTGRLLETDVGASSYEEINEIVGGGNYGWPEAEGPSENSAFVAPLHAYPPAIGRSICGATFYPDSGDFPAEWHGKFFFVDWADHWIKAIDLEAPEKLIPFGDGFEAPVGIAAAPDGSVWVLNRNTRWRDGKEFRDRSGSLVQIRYAGGTESEPRPAEHPATLTETGVFEDPASLQLVEGFHAFELNAPVWLPGVEAWRWIRLPAGKTVEMLPDRQWMFPEGTVVVQHFDSTTGERQETHVYTGLADGFFRAAAYRWNDAGTGADLALHGEILPLRGHDDLHWFTPGAESRLDPDFALVGFVLQLNTQQLNCGDQLLEWRDRGWLDRDLSAETIAVLPRLASLGDGGVPVEDRVRSYLDANCASCHRPGGPSRGLFDARFTTPLAQQGIVGGSLMAGDLGVAGAAVVVPGAPERSALYLRLVRQDAFRMPPVAVNDVVPPMVPLLEEWIRGMKAGSSAPAGEGGVRLIEDAVDESAGDLSAYRIETPAATYHLEKSGAGLSSLVDRDGNDWLGFHPEPGSGAGGEYRGFPNAVHQQAGNYFHARNEATDPSTTRVLRAGPARVTIAAEADNGKWACRYDFTPTHCTFTMTRMPPNKRYWVLYEGTPGGSYDDDDWWMTSEIADKQPLTRNHDGDIAAPEWIAFGDPDLRRALVLCHHEDDEHPDRFYQMHQKMTVFGFGRRGLDKFLDTVPRSVSIGLVEFDGHSDIGAAAAEFARAAAANAAGEDQ